MLLVCLFFVAVLCCQNVLCWKIRFCDFEDSNCLTKSLKKSYVEFINGDLRGLSSPDPIYLDLIEIDQPKLKITLINSTLAGLKSCTPEFAKIHTRDRTYDYHLACRYLTTEGLYEIKGELNSKPIEGKGDFKIDHYDYVFLFHGNYGLEFDNDEKLHLTPKTYKLNDIEVRGKVVYDFKNLYNGDKEKSSAMHKYANEYYKTINKLLGVPVMEIFMNVFMKDTYAYTKKAPIEHIFVH